jgi:hypothetical protein
MSEPIILDGGARMVTITLPAYWQQDATGGGKLSVSPDPESAPFERIVVTDSETGQELLNWPLNPNGQWKIEIK